MRQWRALPASRSVVSLQQYQELFAKPEIRAAFLASVLGRLPIGMSGLAILLLTQSASGSFAYAGAAVASYIAGLASIAPLLGRIIDRSGPARTLLVCGFLYPSALLALCAAVLRTFPMLAILGLAFAAGASYPPITVCMRTFFHQRLGEERLLATAYSLESVLIESIFVLGPMLVAFFVASASPAAAVVSAALCALAGALLFARSPALAHWRIEKLRRGTVLGPLAVHGRPRFAKLSVGEGIEAKIAPVHPDFGAADWPLSLMGFAGRGPERKRALGVLRPKRALPATVLPVMPSRRDCLSNLLVGSPLAR